eukprot:3270539-Rhodomonas_salina.1
MAQILATSRPYLALFLGVPAPLIQANALELHNCVPLLPTLLPEPVVVVLEVVVRAQPAPVSG